MQKKKTSICVLILILLVICGSFCTKHYKFEKYNSVLMQDSLYSATYTYVMDVLHNHRGKYISYKEKRIISNNIQEGLAIYKHTSKASKIPINIFNEYIIPPIIGDEKIENWRIECLRKFNFLKEKNNFYEACDSINKYINKKFRYTIQPNFKDKSWSEYQENLEGDCIDMTKIVLYPLRALGYPVTIDYILAWGNTNGSHYWNSLYKEGVMTPFMGLEKSRNYNPFSIYTHLKDSSKDGLRYPAKIFRLTFTENKEYKRLKQIAGNVNFKLFENLYFKDVTSEYFNVANIKFSIKDYEDKIIYLSVYNRNKWIPISAGQVNQKSIRFINMKTNMLYLLINAQSKAILPPFILSDNKIQFLEANSSYIDIKIKYLKPRILEYQDGWSHISSVPKDYFQGIAEDYYRERPKNGVYYKLHLFVKDKWKFIKESKGDGKEILFKGIPSNGLYIITDYDDKIISRCFTYDKVGTHYKCNYW